MPERPTAEELARALAKLSSCFVPSRSGIGLTRKLPEIEAVYAESVDVLRRFYEPKSQEKKNESPVLSLPK